MMALLRARMGAMGESGGARRRPEKEKRNSKGGRRRRASKRAQSTARRSQSNFYAKSVHPESNQGPSDCCNILQSDALPTEL